MPDGLTSTFSPPGVKRVPSTGSREDRKWTSNNTLADNILQDSTYCWILQDFTEFHILLDVKILSGRKRLNMYNDFV